MFFFTKLVVYCFNLSRNLIYHYIFLHETYCMFVYSTRNMMDADLVHKTSSLWIISQEPWCILIYVIEKLVIFVICSWSLLRVDFCSWKLIYLDVFLCETCCRFIYSFVKPNLSWYFPWSTFLHVGFFFMKYDARWFFFVKIVACGLFLLDFRSSRNSLNFYFFFMKLVHLFLKC